MLKRADVARVVERFDRAPYRLGGWGPTGYDCLSFLVAFYWELGIALPTRISPAITTINYIEAFRREPDEAKRAWADWLLAIGDPVAPGLAWDGDLCILLNPDTAADCKVEAALIMAGPTRYLAIDERVGAFQFPAHALASREMVYRRVTCLN